MRLYLICLKGKCYLAQQCAQMAAVSVVRRRNKYKNESYIATEATQEEINLVAIFLKFSHKKFSHVPSIVYRVLENVQFGAEK